MRKKLLILLLLMMTMVIPAQANTKQTVTLAKCVDGDTTHFMIDGKDTTVRYLAINAPEYTKEKEPYGKEASAYVCDILTNAKKIELEYDDGSDLLDKYGRTLAWVYVDGNLLQSELVKQGLAEVKYIYGDYAYTQQLQELEKDAKAKQLNMWSGIEPEEEDDTMTTYLSIAGGAVLIIAGLFFTKGKRNKEKLVRKGIKQIQKKRK